MTPPDGTEGIAEEAGGGTSTRGADPGVAGNERLTALAGAVLVVPIAVEIATTPVLRAFMAAHIYVGVLIVGPLAIKLGSTGWRFLRYYTGIPAFVRRGPPASGLRLLAPLLVATTLVLFGSGLGLVITGPARPGMFLALHAISAVIWFPMIAIHVVAYIWRVPPLVADDWRRHPAIAAAGRGLRIGVNIGALLAAASAAILAIPAATTWDVWVKTAGEAPGQSFFFVGTAAAILAVVAVRPTRWRSLDRDSKT